MKNFIDDDLEKSSSGESDSEAYHDSNDKTKSVDEKDNDESNELFVKSILIKIKAYKVC